MGGAEWKKYTSTTWRTRFEIPRQRDYVNAIAIILTTLSSEKFLVLLCCARLFMNTGRDNTRWF